MKWLLVFILSCQCLFGANWYASPNGSPAGTGAINSPWDLATAIADNSNLGNPNSVVHAGDTIWLRGGNYAAPSTGFVGSLFGATNNPVTVRQFPSERARIDTALAGANDGLHINGQFSTWWGFEVFNSNTDRSTSRPNGIGVYGFNITLVNLVVHDCGVGIGTWDNAIYNIIHGCICYNNGWQGADPDRGHGVGLYIQNTDAPKFLSDNIQFNQYGNGIQIYGASGGINSITIQSNIAFANGASQRSMELSNNYALGGTVPFTNLVLGSSLGYHYRPATGEIDNDLQLGFDTKSSDGNAIVTNNYLVGGLVKVFAVTNLIFSNNIIAPEASVDGGVMASYSANVLPFTWTWDLNTFYDTAANPFSTNTVNQTFANWKTKTGNDTHSTVTAGNPASNVIFVHTNSFEPNRANVAVYNWQSQDNVSVNLAGVVSIGCPIVVVNAANPFGVPVLLTNYTGGSLSLPMTNLVAAICAGSNAPPPSTGPLFNTFVVMGQTNTAASCSQDDIQAAVAAALPGETVIVPPGNCSITVSILFTNQITLMSQGGIASPTILQDSIINTGDGANSSIFQLALPASPTILGRISGFKFVVGTRATRLFDSGNIHLSGGSSMVRIDNNIFNATLNIPIGGGNVFGVVDHNVMDNVGSFTGGPKITHDGYGGGSFGYAAWTLPSWTNTYQEDGSALYFEDNLCTNSSGSPGIGFDGFGGTREVIRHNTLDRYIAGGHGTETTGNYAGERVKDVYNNLFVNHGDSEAGHTRSGSGVYASNTIVNSSGTFTVRNYRMAFGGFYHYANGTNAWDSNDPSIYGAGTATAGASLQMTDATKTWTPNQWQGFTIRNVNTEQCSLVSGNTATTVSYISPTEGSDMAFTPGQAYQFRKILVVLDQVGRGAGALRNTAAPANLNQAVDPVYCWSNTLDGVLFDMNNGGYYSSQVGREIINGPNPTWMPYQYPHPLISGLVPPTIVSQPKSVTIYSTQTALFSISATGNNPLGYQWKTNGVNAGTNGPTLAVGPAPVAWSGMTIVCVVTSFNGGNATSATATMTVLPDPTITQQPNNATVGVGSTASFTVIASGQSTLSYQWKKEGVNIGGATASTYITPATVAGDNNTHFSVLVTDLAGSLLSATGTLTVTNIISPPDPVITAQPQSTNIFATQTAKFGITATGGSAISLQWTTNGVNVSAGAGGTATPLTLGPCPVVWNGMTVWCTVSDLAGSVQSSTATLTVGADPVISGQPQNVTAVTNSTATFAVSASGQTALSYQWSSNSVAIPGATSSSFTTPPLTMVNNGDSYFVDVTDSAGTLRSGTATLTVFIITPPSRLARVTIMRAGNTIP